MMEKNYQESVQEREETEVHYWKPPCSCGVELGETIKADVELRKEITSEVHSWKPPCSCGISLDKVIE